MNNQDLITAIQAYYIEMGRGSQAVSKAYILDEASEVVAENGCSLSEALEELLDWARNDAKAMAEDYE